MSTSYRSIPAIPFVQLFDGRLEKYDVHETIRSDSTEQRRYLVGRDGALEAYREQDGNSSFTRESFTPVPWAAFDALIEQFDVELVSEHDHRYWGFATQKDWDDWQDQLAKETEDQFYKDLSHHIRGEPSDLRPGTIGMIQAEIAKTLVESDESLILPENRHRLLEAVQAAYDRDHTITITLTKQDLAKAELLAARTDELSQG
jgi:hypothetical protein